MNKNLKVKGSAFAVKLSKQYFLDEKIRGIAVDSYLDKRSKTYVETYLQLYLLSIRLRFFFHLCSLVVALPFLNHFAVLSIESATGVTPHASIGWLIGIVVLFVAEYCQSKTLDTLFNVYFQDAQKLVIGLALMAGFFSVFSIFSSGYSAYTLFSGDATFKMIGVAVSVGIELCLISFTFNIHNFRYKTAKTLDMLNDFGNAKETVSPYFENNKTAAPPIRETAPQAAKKLATKQSSILFTNTGTKKTQKLVPTTEVGQNDDSKRWQFADIKGYRKRYKMRMAEKVTLSRKVGFYCFDYLQQNWKSLSKNGVVKQIPLKVRQEAFKQQDTDVLKAYIQK